MALVVARRAVDEPEYKQWLFRTRPLLFPAISLVVWTLYGCRFIPLFRSHLMGNLRWVCLVALAVQGLLEIWKWGGETPVPPPVVGFFFFSLAAFATATYSLIPLLSFYKAVAFLFALVGLVYGIGLRHMGRPDSWLRLLATVNLVVVGISLLTLFSGKSYDGGLLQGPFTNPNSLGSFLALTFPAVLWLREQHLREAPLLFRSKILTCVVLADLLLLFLSRSRASLLATVLVLVLYAGLRASRFAWLIVYGMIVLTLATPTVAGEVSRNAVFKGRGAQLSLTTRVEEFSATWQAAKSSLTTGVGFGTSVGMTGWDGSLSAATVGREKSNAYLGTVEEVGLGGAVPLFLGLCFALGAGIRSARGRRSTGEGAPAALIAIVAAGALHANFEAWLTSIGAFEAFIFWSTMGVLVMNLPSWSVARSRAHG
jgi:O-antigen ligase